MFLRINFSMVLHDDNKILKHFQLLSKHNIYKKNTRVNRLSNCSCLLVRIFHGVSTVAVKTKMALSTMFNFFNI